MDDYYRMKNLLFAICFGALVVREKDVDHLTGLTLAERAETLSGAALLLWSNKVVKDQRHSEERKGDNAEIKSLKAEVERLHAELERRREHYEQRIIEERRVARLEGIHLGLVGPDALPEDKENDDGQQTAGEA
jgi:hypothetical protein